MNEIFYDPKHPYTWGLLSSMPDLTTSNDTDLIAIPGTPPDLLHPPIGDAFARRSRYALDIDFKEEPPWYKSVTHSFCKILVVRCKSSESYATINGSKTIKNNAK